MLKSIRLITRTLLLVDLRLEVCTDKTLSPGSFLPLSEIISAVSVRPGPLDDQTWNPMRAYEVLIRQNGMKNITTDTCSSFHVKNQR